MVSLQNFIDSKVEMFGLQQWSSDQILRLLGGVLLLVTIVTVLILWRYYLRSSRTTFRESCVTFLSCHVVLGFANSVEWFAPICFVVVILIDRPTFLASRIKFGAMIPLRHVPLILSRLFAFVCKPIVQKNVSFPFCYIDALFIAWS